MTHLNVLDPMLGEVAITSEDDSTSCYVHDIRTGSVLAVFDVGLCERHCLSLIGKDYIINSVKKTRILNIWRLNETVQLTCRIKCPGEVSALAVSSTGAHCIGAIGSKLYVWQVRTGNLFCILDEHRRKVTCVKFSSDGAYFVSGGKDSCVYAWNLSHVIKTGSIMQPKKQDDQGNGTLKIEQRYMHEWRDSLHEVSDIHMGQFGIQSRVAVASYDQHCNVYDLNTGDRIFTIRMDSPLHSVAMDPLEHFLFLGTHGGRIYMLDSDVWFEKENPNSAMEQKNILDEHRCRVTSLSVSVDGQLLLSGSNDSTSIVWDIYARTPIHIVQHSDSVSNAFIGCLPHLLSNDDERPPEFDVKPFQFVVNDTTKFIFKLKPNPHEVCSLKKDKEETLNLYLKERGEMIPFTAAQESYEKLVTAQKINQALSTFAVGALKSTFDKII